jgi:hypothetical protein
MANGASDRNRVFKTKWFSREARKALISDQELCSAIGQVMLGQAIDLGGGVFKKRLGKNLYRSSALAICQISGRLPISTREKLRRMSQRN